MPGLPNDAIKLVLAGSIASVQSWSTGIWLRATLAGGAWGLANQQAVTDAWRTFGNTWWDSLHGLCAADTQFEKVTTYFYDAGSISAVSVAESLVASPVAGTGSAPLPTQSAIVASMRTGVAGRSARGRSYFPLNGQGLGSDHQLSDALCGSVASAYKVLLDELNAYDGTSQNLTSQVCSVASFTKSILRDITQIVVDSKIDTQRRREDKIAPSHTRIVSLA